MYIKLAIQNMKKSIRNYVIYFVTITLTAAMMYVLNGRLVSNTVQWILMDVLSVGFLLVILYWFSRWEGRKNYE